MARPALDAIAAGAAAGLSDVVAGYRHGIVLENPTTGERRLVAGHYTNPFFMRDGVTPIDTTILPADGNTPPVAPDGDGYFWTTAGGSDYNIGIGRTADIYLDAAQIARYRNGNSWIEFDPQLLQYRNDGGQLQSVATPQHVAAQRSGDTLTWPGGYGAGSTFVWIAGGLRLHKRLHLAAVPAPAAYITNGVNPQLELRFDFRYSSTVEPYVNGVRWDVKNNDVRITSSRLEFRDVADGTTVRFMLIPPIAHDDNAQTLAAQSVNGSLRMVGRAQKEVQCYMRIPWSWLQGVTGSFVIDPTVTDQVNDNTEDVAYNDTLWLAGEATAWVGYDSDNTNQHGTAVHFDIGTSLAGATITSAYLEWKCHNGRTDDVPVYIGAEKAATASAPTTKAAFNALTKTTANLQWTHTNNTTTDVWYYNATDPRDIKAIVQELVDAYGASWTSTLMYFEAYGTGTANFRQVTRQHNYASADAMKLTINYTTAVTVSLSTISLAASVPAGSLVAGAVQIALNALAAAASVPAAGVSPGVAAILLNALTLSGAVDSGAVAPGAAAIALNALSLAGSVGGAAVSPGAVAVMLSALGLASSAEAAGVAPGAVAVALAELLLASSAEAGTVAPGAVAVSLNALTLVGAVDPLTASVLGGLVVALNTLQLASSVPPAQLAPGAVAVLLNVLQLAASMEAGAVSPGEVIAALQSLALAGSVPAVSVAPGAVAVLLNALTLASSIEDVSLAGILYGIVALTAEARNFSLTAEARDFSLTAEARDFSLTAKDR